MNSESTTLFQNLQTATHSELESSSPEDLRVPALTILAHPKLERIGEQSVLLGLSSGQQILLSRLEPLFASPGRSARHPLADPYLSRQPISLISTIEGIELRSAKTRLEIDGEPFQGLRILEMEDLLRGVVLLLAERIALLLHYTNPVPERDLPRFGLVGESIGLLHVCKQIQRVADLDVPALLRGETGTGKELVAHAIHEASQRRQAPFIAVNMGAVPPSLAAAELFGAERGAFTGADRKRKGFFMRAAQGTLFLDEIGETPLEVQVQLLRVLETGWVQPVGAESPKRFQARILAATDAELEAEIEARRFRAPLLHRLAGYEIRLPPLRERREDLGRLMVHFLRQELEKFGETWRLSTSTNEKRPWLPARIVAQFAVYSWPGNIRQLRNVVRQLLIANRHASQLKLTAEVLSLFEDDIENTNTPLLPISIDSETPADLRAVDRLRRELSSRSESLQSEPGLGAKQAMMTLLHCDLLPESGDKAPPELMRQLKQLQRQTVHRLLLDYEGHEVGRRRGFLLLFERPLEALGFALEYHEVIHQALELDGASGVSRVGLHFGEVKIRTNLPEEIARGARPVEVEGPALEVAHELSSLARPSQTLLTRTAFDLAREAVRSIGDHPLATPAIHWLDHGDFPLESLCTDVSIFEVGMHPPSPLQAPKHQVSQEEKQSSSSVTAPARPSYRSPDEVGEEELLRALRKHDFRLQPTAASLRVSRTSLYALIDRSDRIRKARDLSREEIQSSQQSCDGDLDAMAKQLEVSRKGLRRRMTQLGWP